MENLREAGHALGTVMGLTRLESGTLTNYFCMQLSRIPGKMRLENSNKDYYVPNDIDDTMRKVINGELERAGRKEDLSSDKWKKWLHSIGRSGFALATFFNDPQTQLSFLKKQAEASSHEI